MSSGPGNSGPLSAQLRAQAEPIWRRELEHPFVLGLGDGTLPVESFVYYLKQDYVFLIEYCRVFALACAKAADPGTMRDFAKLLSDTLGVEMALHRSYCSRFGLLPQELERTAAAPITLGYTNHLLAVAYGGGLAEIIAAILPCQWGYAEVGSALARKANRGTDPRYREWIETYASPDFAAGVETLRGLLDQMTQGWPKTATEPLQRHFLTSSRFEYLFWDMAYARAGWPL
jgi:thiaminase/transcriptional activator TenA